MRSVSPLLIGVVASLGFAPAPVFKERARTPASDLKRLQGTWAMPRYEMNGQTMIGAGEAYAVKIEKDQWTFYRSQNGGPLTKSTIYTLRLDPKASPAEIDFIQSRTYILLGVYDLKGDALKVVFRVNGDGKRDRVKAIATPGPNDYVLELRRKP